MPSFSAEKADAAGIEFFENKVRPVLAENCYHCHSEKSEKLKGNLLLDSREGMLKGGETGPAVVPGDIDKSLLIKAVRYTDKDLQMPPKDKKLASEQIADLEAWVKMGAPAPAREANAISEREAKFKTHWAFQPIHNPEIPKVKSQDWVANPIDAFVQQKLENKGWQHSKAADRRTLIRRATFDLHGLPPTPEEVEAFVNDPAPNAYEQLIDRLLASSRYGERWARHWLDVARYSDTKGYVFEEERRYPYSYTYRDYVIHAFNEDIAFNRFILEQIAADQLELGEDKRPLAAMGFLTLGRRFLNNQPDIIDDRIDVVTRGFMALTVQCARCHDHKYDPIPTKDYYSLYGVFASSYEPGEKPLLGSASLPKKYPEYVKEREKREKELNDFREEKTGEAIGTLRKTASDYMLTAFEADRLNDNSKLENLAKERKQSPQVVRRWINFLKERKKDEHDPVFGPWFAFTALSETNFNTEAKAIAQKFAANETSNPINPIVAKAFADKAPGSLKEVAEIYKGVFEGVNSEWETSIKENPKLERFQTDEKEQVRQVLYAKNGALDLSEGEVMRLFDVPDAQKVRALKRKLDELDATHPGSPPRAMVMEDNSTPTNPHVFLRGNANNRGPEVPRQFLELIAGENRKPFQKGSGRLELAQAIASKDNPLTARVIVNRVWLDHFGAGLVRTPSDFGMRSDPPTHPELLDYLATTFMREGWSLKKLHRMIMLSNTYQQSSEENPEYANEDPANTYLWRMNRRRLEFEPFRDTLLALSGKLDLTEGGHPVEITTEPFTTRRTVYSFIERQNLPGVFRTFDFASPDMSSPQRFNTTVPQQALFMINSPFLAEQARSFVARPEIRSAKDEATKVKEFYQLAFQRQPSDEELKLAEDFIQSQAKIPPPEPPVETWQYGYAELDPGNHAVKRFVRLPHFTGQAWQGGGSLPDSKLGWVTLNAMGGHPGDGLVYTAVRRWIAPRDCSISISGKIEHPSEAGDGVRARIISSREGEIAFLPVYHEKKEMSITRIQVKKGETIDFVVDCHQDTNSDSFNWAPSIQELGDKDAKLANWNSKEQFSGPKELPKPLNAFEKYAQVILMSNELAFVD